MTVRYHQRSGRLSPNYLCQKRSVEEALNPLCQNIPGGVVDEELSRLIVESISPLALEVTLKVQHQLQERLAEADRLRRQVLERAQYDAEQARIRYMRVDPNNRGQSSACQRRSFSGVFSRQPFAGDNDIDRRGLPPIGLPIALWRGLSRHRAC
jgi:hypothetical protein